MKEENVKSNSFKHEFQFHLHGWLQKHVCHFNKYLIRYYLSVLCQNGTKTDNHIRLLFGRSKFILCTVNVRVLFIHLVQSSKFTAENYCVSSSLSAFEWCMRQLSYVCTNERHENCLLYIFKIEMKYTFADSSIYFFFHSILLRRAQNLTHSAKCFEIFMCEISCAMN